MVVSAEIAEDVGRLLSAASASSCKIGLVEGNDPQAILQESAEIAEDVGRLLSAASASSCKDRIGRGRTIPIHFTGERRER